MRPGDAFYGPPLAVPIEGGGRAYEDPETRELLPSITTCLKCIAKPALEGWAARETALAAFDEREAIGRLRDREAAADMLKNARYRNLERAGNLGSLVHRIAEALSTDQPLPEITPAAAPYADAFLGFVEAFKPTFRYVEGTVFNREYKYAGTFDFLAEIDGLPVLGDHKTGKGVYSEVALQIAAARFAEVVWDPVTGDLEPMPEVAGAIVVHLQREGYRVVEIRADAAAFEAFVAARNLWPWACGGGDSRAVGPSLSPQRLTRSFGAVA